ncbi:lternative oxidase [Diaporthe amygdali]|uniref:lternative oxidase n=1 Tax=Phomopsis amygdali TaxID=1214568 RepID=UPI0022FE63A2|nr:lternative oxidase [Diaporthe amygdali]KAJ0118254.1 lternative oxidase [Diaporthe amygdali]
MISKSFGSVARMGRPQLIPILAIGLLLALWTIRLQMPAMSIDYSWFRVGDDGRVTSTSTEVKGLGRPDVSDIDFSDPDAPFVGWPLKRTCNEVTEWVEGVVWLCDNNWGGVGNVRNFILTCLRYAIEAGVTGITLPAIQKRNDDNIIDINSGKDFRHFSYFFDEENFRQALGENCPRITIYDSWAEIPNITTPQGSFEPEIEKISPHQFFDRGNCDGGELDHHTDRFGDVFREWLQSEEDGTPPSAANPRLFRMTDYPGVLWEWPRWHDGPEFSNTFGGLLKFNEQVMRLGKKALENMHTFAQKHARTRDPLSIETRSSAANPSAFMGMHLRTEADAVKFWPTYEEQETAYLAKAKELELPVAYVATGNLSEAHKLSAAADKALGMLVVSKADLLTGDDAEELASLSWDQQGLVDYIVLVGSEYFVGNSRSSFSILTTQKRNLKEEGIYSRPYKVRPGGYGRSMIVGPKEHYYKHWLFIWDSMWP